MAHVTLISGGKKARPLTLMKQKKLNPIILMLPSQQAFAYLQSTIESVEKV